MIDRAVECQVVAALERQAAVAIVGPRQVGKTTLALKIARSRPSIYLDLEAPPAAAEVAMRLRAGGDAARSCALASQPASQASQLAKLAS